MIKLKEIFTKIKNLLTNLFNRNSIKLLEEKTSVKQENLISNEIQETKQETEKEEFFMIYNGVKNGTIKIENLMINDLIKVQMMMQNETSIFDGKIEKLQDEILEMDTELNILGKNKKNYEKKYKKLY